MASYRGHDNATLYSACLLGPVCYWTVEQLQAAVQNIGLALSPLATTVLVVGTYLFSGLLLSNDLDIPSRIYRRWGPLRLLWYPYQRLIPHRSPLSHGLIVGPVLRLLYLYVMLELLLLVAWRVTMLTGSLASYVEVGLGMSAQFLPCLVWYPQISIPCVVGLILAGFCHSLLDRL
jgi:uncharacterized metal-binding protein